MKKMFMLLALSGLVSCASLSAMEEEDSRVSYSDDDETSYQSDNDEDFKIGGEESDQYEDEKVGYIDDQPGE